MINQVRSVPLYKLPNGLIDTDILITEKEGGTSTLARLDGVSLVRNAQLGEFFQDSQTRRDSSGAIVVAVGDNIVSGSVGRRG